MILAGKGLIANEKTSSETTTTSVNLTYARTNE